MGNKQKLSRNNPCHCGSGKKYKHCHYESDHHPSAIKIDYSYDEAVKVPGLPGSYGEFVLQPLPVAGPFTLVLTLKKPDMSPSPLIALRHEQIRGDSNIRFPDAAGDTINMPGNFDGRDVEVTAEANSEHFLAKLKLMGISANNFSDARDQGLPVLTFVLNCLAFEHDVPLDIYQVDVIDEPTGQHCFTVRLPYSVGYLEQLSMTLDMRRHAALYREGLNTPNELYAFLCFFKLVELLERERQIADADIVASGGKPKRRPIVAPENEAELRAWLTVIYPNWYQWAQKSGGTAIPSEARGAKLGHVMEKFLNPLRNRIAHGLLDAEGAIDVDDPSLRRSAKLWTPYCRTIARKLLLERFYTPPVPG